jgi:hypothetical protein
MKRVCVLGIALAAMGCGASVDVEKERAALLAQHDADRKAHFHRDVEGLLASTADGLISVRDGKVERQRAEQGRELFSNYFQNAEFEAWNDLEPPVVQVSPDGKMGWMINRVYVKFSKPGVGGARKAVEFTSAWLAAYEKRDGRWVMVANASTFEPVKEGGGGGKGL